ncbi:hypothetical protein AWC38_SpisGene16634 [Stylophora pistillata]|uniref:Uncharacterized protein n=1 Tax=Stylophora pistillata TaxID=50429 RepID=A0A2B4RRL3_STYPI|nr:hypothetical protein AWC38_SpisGene16634 [Stylophora pistillata]
MLCNLRIIYTEQYLPNTSLLGNVVSPIDSTECLQTEGHSDDGFLLMAVPKKRTTVHKRKLRNRHKQLKNRTDIEAQLPATIWEMSLDSPSKGMAGSAEYVSSLSFLGGLKTRGEETVEIEPNFEWLPMRLGA